MEYVTSFTKRRGVDVGYIESDINFDHPQRVGKSGFDKTLSLEEVFKIAHTMDPKPNIIIKGGPNAKWYFKNVKYDTIEERIKKQQWRDISRVTMYTVYWD